MASAEVRTDGGTLHLFVAVDRTSTFVVARLHSEATRPTACQFPEAILEVVPYRIRILLGNRVIKGATGPSPMARGIQFAEKPRNRNTILSQQSRFDRIREVNDIERRLTKPNHPWTDGQVERTIRTIGDATTKRLSPRGS